MALDVNLTVRMDTPTKIALDILAEEKNMKLGPFIRMKMIELLANSDQKSAPVQDCDDII